MSDVTKILDELAAGSVTSESLVIQCFQTIKSKNDDIFAFVRTYEDEAMAAAKASDARRNEGKPLSRIDGLPIAIKDNFSYQDHVTSSGSNILKNYEAPFDATVVAKLKEAGADIIGQTNMDEFAMGSSTENSAFGVTKNPFDATRVAGGSSGGAAAAVATDMAPLSFGSDTGGSIRQPAAFCGVVGLKPTYGAVSRYGLHALASSLDQIGPLASSVDGVEIGYEAIQGFDPLDSTSKKAESVPVKEHYTIGVPKQFMAEGTDSRILNALNKTLDKLEAAGHTIKRDIDLQILEQSVAIYYIILPAEASANLARYDGIRFGSHGNDVIDSRSQGFGPEVKRRIMLGTYALSAGYADKFYKRAQSARAKLTQELLEVLESVDVLIGPVVPELPFKIGAKQSDPLAMYLSDIYTIPVNLAGLPGLTMPVTTTEEDGVQLPIALQIIGRPWSEKQLFSVGRIIEHNKGAS
jgi:aspartyl-tRNA(Asn)/glutamyl-tRNA(Gln) amidotransferase subunit A